MLGDYNAKHRSWDKFSPSNVAGIKFFELLTEFSLSQCVDCPTRLSSNGLSKSVLDLFATTRPDLHGDSVVWAAA